MSYDQQQYYQEAGGQSPLPQENAEEEVDPIAEMEDRDGLRLSWRAWPTTRLEAKKFVVPLGSVYCPLKNRNEDWYEEQGWHVPNEPSTCTNSTCGAVINPFCDVNFQFKWWNCNLCGSRNSLPRRYLNVTNETRPNELLQEGSTIDYIDYHNSTGPPVFIYCIDTAISEEELDAIKSSVITSLKSLPRDTIVGLITYGKHVRVHELGFIALPKCVVIGGEAGDPAKDSDLDLLKVRRLLGLDKAQQELGPQSPIWKYCCTVNDVEEFFIAIIESMGVDPWTPEAKKRACRCTGSAALVGVSLLSPFAGGYGGRLLLFCGGAATIGQGKVLSTDRSEHWRTFKDIEKGAAPFYEKACSFYAMLAKIAAEQGHVIDIFACCLDQTGVTEQRVLAERTGGLCLLSDTFKHEQPIFHNSFMKIFETTEKGELKCCFNAVIQVICTRNIEVAGCIGPVTSMAEKSACVAEREMGIGGTCKWNIGGMDDNTNLTFIFEVADKSGAQIQDCTPGAVQFKTTYRTGSGIMCTRITNFTVIFRDPSILDGKTEILENFDQDAACVIMTKYALQRKDTEFGFEPMSWVDQQLVRFVKKIGDFRKGDPNSFFMRPEFSFFPQYMFYLRRSPFLDVFGYSPDEASFQRLVMLKESVGNVVMMVEPQLFSWSTDNQECQRVELDASSIKPNVVLLLDTFFNIVVWYGKDMNRWRSDGTLAENPEYKWLFELLECACSERQRRADIRQPYPVIITTWDDESQERFLTSKLNPSGGAPSEYGETPKILTENVSLRFFMDHLKRLAVDEN